MTLATRPPPPVEARKPVWPVVCRNCEKLIEVGEPVQRRYAGFIYHVHVTCEGER